jgi:hypothetical protein
MKTYFLKGAPVAALLLLPTALLASTATAKADSTSALINQLGHPGQSSCPVCDIGAAVAEDNARRAAEARPLYSVPDGSGGQTIYGTNGYMSRATPNGSGGYNYQNMGR